MKERNRQKIILILLAILIPIIGIIGVFVYLKFFRNRENSKQK